MSAPGPDQDYITLAITVPPEGFCSGDRVWVRRADSWRPGIVLIASARAATVRYRRAGSRETGVDTVSAHSLAPRNEDDLVVDHAPGPTRLSA